MFRHILIWGVDILFGNKTIEYKLGWVLIYFNLGGGEGVRARTISI